MGDPLALFGAALAWFHVSEFAMATVFQRSTLSHRSLLISLPYTIAMSAAVAEYVLERRLGMPKPRPLLLAGAALAAAGDALRKSAMLTARGAFRHDLERTLRAGHALVTGGPYALVRHPGYLGFAAFAVGTQVALANPVCAVAFAVATRRFFAARVAVEERLLVRFFGDAYIEYAARTPTWMPGVGLVPVAKKRRSVG